jgi:hypothetical protein
MDTDGEHGAGHQPTGGDRGRGAVLTTAANAQGLALLRPGGITTDQLAALAEGKERAAARQVAEARIPRHLLYERSGWPKVLSTPAEAQLLAEVRRAVAAAIGISIRYTTGDAVHERMAELMEMNARKLAAKEAKEARRALRPVA